MNVLHLQLCWGYRRCVGSAARTGEPFGSFPMTWVGFSVKPRTGSQCVFVLVQPETPLSHDGGYFHSHALVFHFPRGCFLCNWISAGMTFLSKSSHAVVLFRRGLCSEYLTNTQSSLLRWMWSAAFRSETLVNALFSRTRTLFSSVRFPCKKKIPITFFKNSCW